MSNELHQAAAKTGFGPTAFLLNSKSPFLVILPKMERFTEFIHCYGPQKIYKDQPNIKKVICRICFKRSDFIEKFA